MIPIVTSNGNTFDPDGFEPEVVGYQIKHVITGRILPSTSRRELYSMAAAIRKMNTTAVQFNMMGASLDIWDYRPEPVYDFECPNDYIYINDKDDNLF